MSDLPVRRVLLTGSEGQVGRASSRALEAAGFDVVPFDRANGQDVATPTRSWAPSPVALPWSMRVLSHMTQRELLRRSWPRTSSALGMSSLPQRRIALTGSCTSHRARYSDAL